MRALRSRTVQSDSSNEEQNTLNVVSDKRKRNKKASKHSTEPEKSVVTKSPEHIKKNRKHKRTSEESNRTKRTTRHSIAVNIKENVSPNPIEQNVRKKRKNKKSRRSPKPDSPEKPNKTTNNKSSLSSTFDKTSHEYSPTFKNIVTSTTIKPKRKLSNKSNNILLQNDSEIINITNVLNSTYTKDEDESKLTTTNNSGQWKIEQKSVINISDDTKNQSDFKLNESIENNKDVKKVIFQEAVKSARKKWQRFARNSQGANSVLEQITPQKKIHPNKSLKEESIKKSIKRTVMPNFALIHQKAFEKMESISDYSQRKKTRAQLLLSNKKEGESIVKATSSRQLFNETDPKKFNRFGFKVNQPVKPSIYARDNIVREKEMIHDRVAIANKKVQTGKFRENKREMLKGVRTNRRFELLMKMRNN